MCDDKRPVDEVDESGVWDVQRAFLFSVIKCVVCVCGGVTMQVPAAVFIDSRGFCVRVDSAPRLTMSRSNVASGTSPLAETFDTTNVNRINGNSTDVRID